MRLLTLSVLASVILSGCAREPDVHPGNDFPVAWLPSEVPQDVKTSFQRNEDARKAVELSIQKMHFKQWCDKHNIAYDPAVVDSWEFVGGEWIASR